LYPIQNMCFGNNYQLPCAKLWFPSVPHSCLASTFPILIHALINPRWNFVFFFFNSKYFAFTPADIQGLHFKAGHGAERRIGQCSCLESHGLLWEMRSEAKWRDLAGNSPAWSLIPDRSDKFLHRLCLETA